ncbi:MAG: serine O-acetyltransferase [Devosiaceae bacterium]|nr:serine O-acetyltransferase [Devosiaceae bacterium]
MSLKAKQKKQVKELDPIWSSIRQEAEEIVKNEPTLASFIISNILNHDSFESALSHRLAQRLDHLDLSADLIRQTFNDILEKFNKAAYAARVDIVATKERDPACHRLIEPFLYYKGYQAIQTHRIAHELYKLGRIDIAYYLQSRSSQTFQVDINPAVIMGQGIMLDHGTGVVIGETSVIGDNVSILQGVTLGGTGKVDGDRHPKVGSGVLIGAGAKILGDITIGDCARVASGSVVLKDVPSKKTVAGVPAKIVGEAGCAYPSLSMDQMLSKIIK